MALLIGFLLYVAIVLLPHIDTLVAFARGGTWGTTLQLATGLLIHNAAFIGTAAYTVFLFLLIGLTINIALAIELWDLVRSRISVNHMSRKSSGKISSIFASIFAILGYGCGACGTAVSSTLFTALGLSVVSSYLPLRGIEFSLFGILLIIFSIRNLVFKIRTVQIMQV
jgi:hypothetical protein